MVNFFRRIYQKRYIERLAAVATTMNTQIYLVNEKGTRLDEDGSMLKNVMLKKVWFVQLGDITLDFRL